MKILVVKRDKLGDLLLTTPMLAHLRASLPRAEVHVLANDYNAWVVKDEPSIDRLWTLERVQDAGAGRLAAAFRNLLRIRRLRRERFDWVLVGNGDHSARAVRLGLRVRGRRTVAYGADEVSDPLPLAPRMHEADRLTGLLAPLGIAPPAQPAWPRYALPAEAAAFARGWLAERGLSRYVVLGLGARRPKKQPSAAQVLRWAERLRARRGLDTVFMWTPGASDDPRYPGDDAVAQPILDARAPFIHPFRGPILEALGLVWGARASLFPDSGLMHFAAASPGGVLGFFAETAVSPSPDNWAPRGPRALWLEADTAVSELSDEQVFESLERLLGE